MANDYELAKVIANDLPMEWQTRLMLANETET